MKKKYSVAVVDGIGLYPESPYAPSEKYPEYPGEPGSFNPVYAGLRGLFLSLGMDKANFGSPSWNPFGKLIFPGDTVFIKPNLVADRYGREKSGKEGDLFSVITHPSVVRAVADYAARALKGRGRVLIGDNPSIDADFSVILERTKLKDIASEVSRLYGVECQVLDLRPIWCDDLANYGKESKMKPLPGDPAGEIIVDLGKSSFFSGSDPRLFRGVFTDRKSTIEKHSGGKHEYAISRSIYDADVYISVPKLKTHHKVGATLNIKGLVGACSRKNYLIHWKVGYPDMGGDEYPYDLGVFEKLCVRAEIALSDLFPGKFRKFGCSKRYSGSWEGNDSAWRMAADLYLAMKMEDRRAFSVIDGVLAGEKDGPFLPDAKKAGVMLASENLLAADYAAVKLMGFDHKKIRYISELLRKLDITEKEIVIKGAPAKPLSFAAPSHWPGLISGAK